MLYIPLVIVLNDEFSLYICRTSFRMTLLHCTRRSVRAEYRTVLESRRVLLLSSTPEFHLQRFRLQVVLNMGAHSNPRRGLKSAQEQEDRRRCRNERDRARRAADTAEQRSERLRKRRERNRARRAAQTASERQATSRQRSTCERERMAAESPEERERLQRMSTNQQKRLAVETPEERKHSI